MNKFKVLIKNTNTNKKKWYTCPLDKDTIFNELELTSNNYVIKDSDGPYPLEICDSIDQVVNEYNAYLLLPDYIQNHIHAIAFEYDYIADTLNAYNNDKIDFYPGVTSKRAFVIEYMRDNHIVKDELLEFIDYDKYFEHLSETLNILLTADGAMILN